MGPHTTETNSKWGRGCQCFTRVIMNPDMNSIDSSKLTNYPMKGDYKIKMKVMKDL